MARIRTIKPDFFYDDELALLSIEARLFFIGLWLYADREGRLEDKPGRLKAQIFPYDDYSGDDLISQLTPKFLTRYENSGKKFIQIKNFLKHQMPHYKEVPSEIPKPESHIDSGYNASPVRAEDKEYVYERDGNKCRECKTSKNLSVDHIIPRVHGGHSGRDNLQILCRDCNSAKSANGERRLARSQPNVELTSHPGREGNGMEVVGNGLEVIKQPGQAPIDLKNLGGILKSTDDLAGDFGDYRLPVNFGGRYGRAHIVSLTPDDCRFILSEMKPGPKVRAALEWRLNQKKMECAK